MSESATGLAAGLPFEGAADGGARTAARAATVTTAAIAYRKPITNCVLGAFMV
jgi:hypothetical protein